MRSTDAVTSTAGLQRALHASTAASRICNCRCLHEVQSSSATAEGCRICRDGVKIGSSPCDVMLCAKRTPVQECDVARKAVQVLKEAPDPGVAPRIAILRHRIKDQHQRLCGVCQRHGRSATCNDAPCLSRYDVDMLISAILHSHMVEFQPRLKFCVQQQCAAGMTPKQSTCSRRTASLENAYVTAVSAGGFSIGTGGSESSRTFWSSLCRANQRDRVMGLISPVHRMQDYTVGLS
jgi:hypothetical protein